MLVWASARGGVGVGGTTLAWWVFQLRWDVPGCGESLVRVWWEVVVFPLLLRAMWLELWGSMMGSAVFAIYAGCACALCIVCVCALVYVICFLCKLLLSGVREGWYR